MSPRRNRRVSATYNVGAEAAFADSMDRQIDSILDPSKWN